MVLYAALLFLGVTLLAITAARVLLGGIADSPGSPKSARPTRTGSAQEILEERYAAGELSADEFQRRLRVLHGDR